MVITKLAGGLCNQMFQYAIARNLAKQNHTKLLIDTSFLEESVQSKDFTKRKYELSKFKIKAKISTPEILQGFETESLKPRFGVLKQTYTTIKEKSLAFDEDILKQRGNIYLEGHWASEKYFKTIRSTLLKELSLRDPLGDSSAIYLEQIKKSKSVSIHVRRGDYVTSNSANKFHGTCDMDYYKRCMDYIDRKQENITYFVFSDDIEWCMENFKSSNVVFVQGNTGEEDLSLMKNCKHNIIANSTFSWWAAWLNESPEKIVIAPKKWFNDLTVNTGDLLPEEWIKL